MMEESKICPQCRRENQTATAKCSHGDSPLYSEDLEHIRESLVRKVRTRVIYGWIIVAIGFCGLACIGPPAPWYRRLLSVLLGQLMIAAWFGLLLYVQAKAGAQTPEGESFRGPMPPGRAAFWTCFAAAGVFCIEYWTGRHQFWLALGGALFCSSFIAGFAFILNWVGGEHGKAWARKYRRQILTAYGFVLTASVILKVWDFLVQATPKD